MLHMVYHKKYKPMTVDSEDYVALLTSGEWFDNPQLDPGDIQNEIQKYENAEGQKPKHKFIRKDAGNVSKDKTEPRHQKKEEVKSDKPPPKKRGRPPKSK